MEEKSKKNIQRDPQEEFIDDGVADTTKEQKPNADLPDYEKWSLEQLRSKAKKENVKNYNSMRKSELIQELKNLHN